MRLRVWASVALLVLFPGVVLALLMLIGILFLFGVKYADRLGGQVLVLAFPLVAAILAVLREVWRLRSVPPAAGLEIAPEDEPELWAEIEDVATAMGEDLPDRLVLDGDVNASVTEASGERELIIGLPLLVGLTRAELRAVIAHELGHLAHGHTRGSEFVYRAQYFLVATVDIIDPGLVQRLLTLYLRLFDRVSSSVRREQERQADLWAARLAGPEAAMSSLDRLHYLHLAWQHVLRNYGPALRRDAPRGSLAEALVEVMRDSHHALEEAAERRPPRTSPYDSHPPVPERIALLRRLPEPDPRSAPYLEYPHEPAWSWLIEPRRRMAEVEAARIAPGSPAEPADWATVLTARFVESSRETAGQLIAAVHQIAPQAPPTLDTVLRIIASGRGNQLIEPLMRADVRREDRDSGARTILGVALMTAIGTVLAQDRRIRVVPDFSPEGPIQIDFLAPDGRVYAWPFDDVVNEAVEDPSGVRALAEALISAGVDLYAPVTEAGELEGAVAVAAIGWTRIAVKGPAKRQLRVRGGQDVLVFDAGILARRTPKAGRMTPWRAIKLTLTPRRHYRARVIERIQRWSEQVGDQPQTWAADHADEAIWLPFGLVEEVKRRDSWAAAEGHVMKLALRDGSTVKIETASAGVWLNDPDAVIAAAIS